MKSSFVHTNSDRLETAIQALVGEALKKGFFSGSAAGFEFKNGIKNDRKIWTFGSTDQNSDNSHS